MTIFSIVSHKTGKTIYSGAFSSMRHCIQDAIERKIDLSYADLRHCDLTNGNFDGAVMPYAILSGANLSGANLSEATLHHSIFTHTDLYNTCLFGSDLHACDFSQANFGGTDICDTDISHSIFSTLSCLDLDFMNVRDMSGCEYITHDEQPQYCAMSKHPVIIKGLFHTPIVIFDQVIKVGGQIFHKDVFPFLIYTLEQQYPLCAAKNSSIQSNV